MASLESFFIPFRRPNHMILYESEGGSSGNQWGTGTWDRLSDNLGVLMNYGEEPTVVNLYETEEYETIIRTMREWYEAGYVNPDTTTATETSTSLIAAGNVFCTISSGTPLTEETATQSVGYPMGVIPLGEALSTTANIADFMWGIPYAAQEPEAAMKFLNLMYSDPEVSDLLNYGIEGIHYVVQEDGSYDYLEGEDMASCTYHPQMDWLWPNSYIAGQWEGTNPDKPAIMQEFNANARKSIALGFNFDNTDVINEVTACNNVLMQYTIGLEVGALDVDTVLPEFRAALKDAGIDRVIAEKQAQLDAWLAENGE